MSGLRGIFPTTDMVVSVPNVLWEREGGYVAKRLTGGKKLVVRLQGGSVDVTMSVTRARDIGFDPNKGNEGPATKPTDKTTLTFAQPVGAHLGVGQRVIVGLSMVSKFLATKDAQPKKGVAVLSTTNFNALGVFKIRSDDVETAPDVITRTISRQGLIDSARATPSKKTE